MNMFLILRFCFLVLHRYASLYFCVAIEKDDNELLTLEIIHRYVELLDKYFGSVSTVITNFAVTKSRKPYVIICFFGLLILSIIYVIHVLILFTERFVSWISFLILRRLILCWMNWFLEERSKKQARKMSWKQYQPKIFFRR